ncbi:hypothetical protein GCM10010399_84490 [Dactylosporangium fulvum]|uniref:Integral membrane protein n=1 Tax=Dactylosporangium fulvum TaxID=53359 RepID=A0ABY5VS00_9ACTN|nr:hypothetical protein [Dactylosporangium fulvum]UWP79977.1 hypothetical protein Dfulv_33085 [Dactylosporangium fulvum]
MGVLTRFTRGCLRLAARRWPAELRDDLSRDWLAELAVLEGSPGAAWRRFTFVVSLAAHPLAYDEDGVPRSRWEWWRAPGPALRAFVGLLLAGGFAVGVWTAARVLLHLLLLDDIGVEDELRNSLLVGAVATTLASGYAAVAGWWLGNRAAAGTHHARIRGQAGLAIGALGIVLVYAGASDNRLARAGLGSFAIMVAVWALATFAVVIVTSRRVAAGQVRQSWGCALAGAPLAAVLAPIPLEAFTDDVAPVPWRIAQTACRLLPLTVCAVSFGWAAARARPAGAAWIGPAVVPSAGAVPPAGPAELPVPAGAAVRTWWLTTAQVTVAMAAAGAAVLWAIGLVLLQPLSEPAAGSLGENNTYWARELRWAAIVAVVLAVVVCARARQRATREALLGGLVWLAVDLALDRAGLSHGTVPLAVVAAAVAVAGCYRGITDRSAPRRGGLLVVAAVAAVLSGVSVLTESPTDTEPALNPGSAAAGCALALVAIGAALSAAPRLSRVRCAVGCLGGAVAATAPWLLRDRYPQPTATRELLGLGFTVLPVLCVMVLAWRRPETPGQWLRWPAMVAGTLLVFPLVFLPAALALAVVNVGAVFTALAGNPPVNVSDTDMVGAMPAVLAGLVLGWLLVRGEPRSPHRDEASP